MKTVNAGLLVAVGLTVLYLAITGKLERVGDAWRALTGAPPASGDTLPTVAPIGPVSAPRTTSQALADVDVLALPNLFQLPSLS